MRTAVGYLAAIVMTITIFQELGWPGLIFQEALIVYIYCRSGGAPK